jgi:hypothetical protein
MGVENASESSPTELKFECPTCGQHISATRAQIGVTAPCPNCNAAVTVPNASTLPPPLPPSPQPQQPVALQPLPFAESVTPEFVMPARLPFFKSGRRELLVKRFEQLLNTRALMDDGAESELKKTAVMLGLQENDASALLTERFTRDFEHIKRRMESSFVMTDEDVAEIEQLKRKYNVRLTLRGNASLFRAIYLLEVRHELPPPVVVDLMLETNEICYYAINTTWHQSRVQTRGYSGTSVSVPMGIRGVRFRFGGYTPVRTEQMTPLAPGVLYITSKRLFFGAESRNTTIGLKKIVDGHVFSDCVKIEKNSGKADLFSMNAAEARYILSLIGVLKQELTA